jgi:hypothetical protein
MSDGTYPIEGCYYCYRFIVEPSLRERHNVYPSTSHGSGYRINLDELDELAAQEAA